MSSPLNIGLRHILPIFPFLLLIVAAAGRELIASRRRMARVALGAAALFWLVEFGSVYPNTLTFFNQFVGGPRNGFKYLADSNLGWGQGLKSLKRWMNRNGVSHINLAYFGQADPAYHGITCTHLPGAPRFAEQLVAKPRLPGYVAISSTVLSGVYLQPRWRVFYKPFRDLPPVAVVGNSIRVYWVTEWPKAGLAGQPSIAEPSDIDAHLSLADALLVAMQWYDQAVFHYREYLTYRPGNAGVMTRYAIALSESGSIDEGIQMFRRAVELAPADERTHRNLEQALLKAGRPGGSALARR
jgi:tetratricopeptide (TPR) repeat protein